MWFRPVTFLSTVFLILMMFSPLDLSMSYLCTGCHCWWPVVGAIYRGGNFLPRHRGYPQSSSSSGTPILSGRWAGLGDPVEGNLGFGAFWWARYFWCFPDMVGASHYWSSNFYYALRRRPCARLFTDEGLGSVRLGAKPRVSDQAAVRLGGRFDFSC